MSDDIVRVIRIYEFVGPRSVIEEQVEKSIHGARQFWGGGALIRAVTLGTFPEILKDVPWSWEEEPASE